MYRHSTYKCSVTNSYWIPWKLKPIFYSAPFNINLYWRSISRNYCHVKVNFLFPHCLCWVGNTAIYLLMQNRGDFAFILDAITYQVFFSFRGGVFRTSGMIRLYRNLFRKVPYVEEGLYKTIQHLPNLIANGYWRLCHDCWNKWAKVHWLKKGQKRSSIQRITWSVKRLLEAMKAKFSSQNILDFKM